ncbi:dihydrofolate reductase, partial [Daphnia magna]|uniref:dihydrofolate reductase n=1 Tax=Daphnia magna TaxID=35525 RepID=UPI001E1BD5EA
PAEMKFPRLELMVAADTNLGIGKENKMAWHLPTEFSYYRRMTTSPAPGSNGKVHASIFATKTWQSIPQEMKPWGNTICFILSRSMTAKDVQGYSDVYIHSSIEDIIAHIRLPEMRKRIDRVWMHGGAFGYQEALRSKHFYRIYLTKIHAEFQCDVFFPRYDENRLKLVHDPDVPQGIQVDHGISYQVHVYETTGACPLIEDFAR